MRRKFGRKGTQHKMQRNGTPRRTTVPRIGIRIGCCVGPFCIGGAWATWVLGQGDLASTIGNLG